MQFETKKAFALFKIIGDDVMSLIFSYLKITDLISLTILSGSSVLRNNSCHAVSTLTNGSCSDYRRSSTSFMGNLLTRCFVLSCANLTHMSLCFSIRTNQLGKIIRDLGDSLAEGKLLFLKYLLLHISAQIQMDEIRRIMNSISSAARKKYLSSLQSFDVAVAAIEDVVLEKHMLKSINGNCMHLNSINCISSWNLQTVSDPNDCNGFLEANIWESLKILEVGSLFRKLLLQRQQQEDFVESSSIYLFTALTKTRFPSLTTLHLNFSDGYECYHFFDNLVRMFLEAQLPLFISQQISTLVISVESSDTSMEIEQLWTDLSTSIHGGRRDDILRPLPVIFPNIQYLRFPTRMPSLKLMELIGTTYGHIDSVSSRQDIAPAAASSGLRLEVCSSESDATFPSYLKDKWSHFKIPVRELIITDPKPIPNFDYWSRVFGTENDVDCHHDVASSTGIEGASQLHPHEAIVADYDSISEYSHTEWGPRRDDVAPMYMLSRSLTNIITLGYLSTMVKLQVPDSFLHHINKRAAHTPDSSGVFSSCTSLLELDVFRSQRMGSPRTSRITDDDWLHACVSFLVTVIFPEVPSNLKRICFEGCRRVVPEGRAFLRSMAQKLGASTTATTMITTGCQEIPEGASKSYRPLHVCVLNGLVREVVYIYYSII